MWLWASAGLTLGALFCGALLAPPASLPPARGLTLLLLIGSSFHVAATGYLFTVGEVRAHAWANRRRYLHIPVLLVAVAAAAAALSSQAELGWLLLVYFSWQFFHFQKQNIGLVALAASGHNHAPLSRAERKLLLLASVAGIAALLAHPGLLQLRVDTHLSALFPLAALSYVITVGLGVRALLQRPRRDRGAGFTVAFLTSLLFFAPVFIFGDPYAAVAGMTIAHGLQYLLLVGLVSLGDRRGPARWFGPVVLINVAVVGGLALSAASHLHTGPAVARLVFGAYLGVVMSHFVVDAGLWRLRHAFPRAFLSSRLPYLLPIPAAPLSLMVHSPEADIP
jgi:hypothetical protein